MADSRLRTFHVRGIARLLAPWSWKRGRAAAFGEPNAIELDLSAHRVRGPVSSVRLTKIEWDLLLVLVNHPGRILSHEAILQSVWGATYTEQHHLVHDNVSRLRHHLRNAGIIDDPIENFHGFGYRLKDDSNLSRA